MTNAYLGADDSSEERLEDRTERYRRIRMYDLDRRVMEELNRWVEELDRFYPMMPRVDENGDSPCPFAESLYRKKADLEAKVSERMAVLMPMRDEIDWEVGRCERNLVRESIDAEELRRSGAKYERKGGFIICNPVEDEYVGALKLRSQVDAALERAQATLAASREKQYPAPL